MLTILKYGVLPIVDVAIIGCVIHFFYMSHFRPVDLAKLERRTRTEFAESVGVVAYFLTALLGIGLCLYGGLVTLFSWMPRSWVDADGQWIAQVLSGILAVMGSIGWIVITFGTVENRSDLETKLDKLEATNSKLTNSNSLFVEQLRTVQQTEKEKFKLVHQVFANEDYFRQYVTVNRASLNAGHPPNGWTLLQHLAALGNEALPVHAKMAEELLSLGADVNCRTMLGWTPLHFIAINGQAQTVELAKVLIAHGLDLTAVDNQGRDWKLYWQHGKEIYDLLENASKLQKAPES
jgi:hypothetical protein